MFWLYVGAVFVVVVFSLWVWERGKNHRVGRLDPKARRQVDRAAEQSHRQQTRNTFGNGGL